MSVFRNLMDLFKHLLEKKGFLARYSKSLNFMMICHEKVYEYFKHDCYNFTYTYPI